MKFVLWTKGKLARIYVNGVSGYNGKIFFEKRGKLAVLAYSGNNPDEQIIDEIINEISRKFGFEDCYSIDFKEFQEKLNTQSSSAGFGRANSGMVDKENSAKALDITTIKMPNKIKVVVDTREPEELVSILKLHPQIDVEVEQLELGDIIINDTVIIERKNCTSLENATDFENSIIDKEKRLFTQSERLKLQDDFVPIILLEGSCYDNSKRMLVQQIDGAVSFLAVIQRISVLATYNLNHTAYMIAKLGTHQQDGLGYELGLRAKSPSKLLDKRAFVLEGISGVSAKIAKDLLEHFGTIQAVSNSTIDELMRVDGIGKTKASKILEVLQ